MNIKKYMLLGLFILLSSLTYADTWSEDSSFFPPLSNATYILSEDITVDNLTVNNTCLILDFGYVIEEYCNVYAIPTNITLNFSFVHVNYSYSYGDIGVINNFSIDLNSSIANYNFATTTGEIIIPHNVILALNNTANITVYSNESGGYLPRNYSNQNVTEDFNAEIWQSEIHVTVRDGITSNYVNLARVNHEFNSEFMTDLTSVPITYYLPTGEYHINATHEFYIPSNTTSGNITNQEILYIEFNLSSILTFSFFREETGEPFDFVETDDPYSCSNSTYNETQFFVQESADDITCEGDFSDVNVCANGYDGYDTTFAKASIINGTNVSSIIESYTKILDTTNASKVNIQTDLYSFVNYTLPINCYNQNPVIINSTSDMNNGYLNISCYNGTEFESIASLNNGGLIYDSQMYWAKIVEVPNQTLCSNTTDVSFNVQIVCPGKRITQVINNNNTGILGLDCDYDYWLITAEYSTTSYYRTVIPPKTERDFEIYLLDLNVDDAVEVIIKVIDISDKYTNAQMRITTYVNETEKTVIQQYLDIENKVSLWLDKNQIYRMYAINDDGEESYVGDLLASEAATRILTLPSIPLIDADYLGKDVYWTYDADKDLGTAEMIYIDNTASGYDRIDWKIYDSEAQSFIYNLSSVSGYNITLNVSSLDKHKSYMSVLTITHPEYNAPIEEVRPLWLASATVFEGWGTTYVDANGYEVNDTTEKVKLVIAILIPIILILLFSQGTIEVGMAISLIFIYIFNLYNWYNAIPYWETLDLIIISLFAVLTVARVIQKMKNK